MAIFRSLLVTLFLFFFCNAAHAAFPVHVYTDSAVVASVMRTQQSTVHTKPSFIKSALQLSKYRDRYSYSPGNGQLATVSCVLSYCGLFGLAAVALMIYLGVFVAVEAWIPIALIILFWLSGVAGFITGLVALSQHPVDRRRAKQGTLIGSLFLGPLVAFITFVAINIPGRHNR